MPIRTIDFWTISPLLALLVLGLVLYLRRRGVPTVQLFCITAFCAYLAGVAALTVFPIVFDRQLVHAMRVDGVSIAHGLNLVPFKGISGGSYSSSQVVGNFVLGLPFGFGLPFVGVRSGWRVLVWGLLFALAIEGAQLALNLAYGFAFRVVDINDVILNFLGVVAGMLAFLLVSAPYRWLGRGNGRGGGPSYLRGVLSAR
jgi:glycopeptide antibiotics resistance protein